MAMQSEFYKDLSTVENRTFKVTKTQFKAIIYLTLTTIVIIVEAFFIPQGILFYVVGGLTGTLLGAYPVLLLLGKWREYRRKIELFFLHEDRYLQSHQIRRYSKDEFIQAETVKETDAI